jgi:hypothetical protein
MIYKGNEEKEKKEAKKAGERGWGGCGSEGHYVLGVLRRIGRGEGVEPGIATWGRLSAHGGGTRPAILMSEGERRDTCSQVILVGIYYVLINNAPSIDAVSSRRMDIRKSLLPSPARGSLQTHQTRPAHSRDTHLAPHS